MTRSPAFLSRLERGAVDALSKHWIVRTYAPHELIVAHGEIGRDVFFVLGIAEQSPVEVGCRKE